MKNAFFVVCCMASTVAYASNVELKTAKEEQQLNEKIENITGNISARAKIVSQFNRGAEIAVAGSVLLAWRIFLEEPSQQLIALGMMGLPFGIRIGQMCLLCGTSIWKDSLQTDLDQCLSQREEIQKNLTSQKLLENMGQQKPNKNRAVRSGKTKSIISQ